MDKLIIIGTIIKPQGIKGEVKIKPFTDDAMRFNRLKNVIIDNTKHEIESIRINGNDVFIKFIKINDRNTAETYRNKDVFLPENKLGKPKDGRYLIKDLIGCNVYVADKLLGNLVDILQNGAADVYVVNDTNNKSIMFPAVKDLMLEVKVEEKIIIIDGKRLDEVAVYED